jgi:Tol biopolymer transport system component
MIIWASNHRVHLTWAKADGTGQHDISDNLQSIDRITFIRPGAAGSQKWISYLANRSGVYSIELAELETGQHYPLLAGVKAGDSWSFTLSPDGHTVALVLQSYATSAFQNRLYLVPLDGKGAHQISNDMLGTPNWSPDGSTIAYIQPDAASSIPYVKLINADGAPIKSIPLISSQQGQVRASRNQTTLFNWTRCS